jgi:SAM-dependent methyltransferase
VGLYSQWVFPLLCDLALSKPFVATHRRRLLASATGNVLEIGFGTGLNLPCYPPDIRKITTVDPNAGMHRRAMRRIRQTGIAVEHHTASGERLPFGDEIFDCVVSTFTLCSIPQVNPAIAEVYRVLRPGGRLLFLEHGLSPEPAVQKWQHRLNGLQSRLGDGCRLDRPIKDLICAHPFSVVEATEFYLDRTPKTHGYVWCGSATK